MLCVFDSSTARAPAGLESYKSPPRHHRHPQLHPDDDEVRHSQELCQQVLDRVYSASKSTVRHLEMFGQGSGFTFEATPYCSYANKDGVHVLFAGEVSDWPGINAVSAAHDAFMQNAPPLEVDDAHWLLDFYGTFMDCTSFDITETALDKLSQVAGSFAFVLFDQVQNRVLAARDQDGSQPLYWGATEAGQLMFGSDPEDLLGCDPTATAFPSGTLFASERHTVAYSPGTEGWVIENGDVPGQLLSFLREGRNWKGVKAIPRINSKGVMCGSVYKVASSGNLTAPAQPMSPRQMAAAKREQEKARRIPVRMLAQTAAV